MVENASRNKRSRGRPPLRSDVETRALIIAAAAREFLAHGYAGTDVETIARRAGVSTRTLYRLVPTKEDLLKEAVQTRIDVFFGRLREVDADAADLGESLMNLLEGYVGLTLTEEAVVMARLIATEGRQVPAIAAIYQQATSRVAETFEAWVRRNQAVGRLRPMDPAAAAMAIRGMVNEAQRQMVLGWRGPMDEGEQRTWIRFCAGIFLDGAA